MGITSGNYGEKKAVTASVKPHNRVVSAPQKPLSFRPWMALPPDPSLLYHSFCKCQTEKSFFEKNIFEWQIILCAFLRKCHTQIAKKRSAGPCEKWSLSFLTRPP